MLTRRSSKFTGLVHAFGLFGLSTLLVIAGACDDDKDDGSGDEVGDGDGDGDNSTGNTNSTGNDGNDDGADLCDEACVNLESCGIPLDDCLGFCGGGACATCLASSGSCGQDCLEACSSEDPTGDGDGDPTGDGDGDGDPTGDPPDKECVKNNECGISFECVSCNLTDNEGWCEQSSSCSFDNDCGIDGKCGYNVESGDWRCLPADYCQ